jgi:hypothetical protein
MSALQAQQRVHACWRLRSAGGGPPAAPRAPPSGPQVAAAASSGPSSYTHCRPSLLPAAQAGMPGAGALTSSSCAMASACHRSPGACAGSHGKYLQQRQKRAAAGHHLPAHGPAAWPLRPQSFWPLLPVHCPMPWDRQPPPAAAGQSCPPAAHAGAPASMHAARTHGCRRKSLPSRANPKEADASSRGQL